MWVTGRRAGSLQEDFEGCTKECRASAEDEPGCSVCLEKPECYTGIVSSRQERERRGEERDPPTAGDGRC